uniref:Uncharacterized protein n=1 Tax=Arundo donax TaxID=35708 RepID=A0A0A9DZ91_ARUDO
MHSMPPQDTRFARRIPTHSSPCSVRRNTIESPATSFFWFTNVLHPVVSKCRRGVPR